MKDYKNINIINDLKNSKKLQVSRISVKRRQSFIIAILTTVASTYFLATASIVSAEGMAFNGYCKNIVFNSDMTGSDNDFSDIARARLEIKDYISEKISTELSLDNEIVTGGILKSENFISLKNAKRISFLEHQWIVKDTTDLLYRVSTCRAFLKYDYEHGDIIAGQQRIAWGSAKMWNPTDLFNPYNPLTLERDERNGVDAIRVEHSFSSLSRIVAVHAPGANHGNDKSALKYQINLSEFDISAMAGRFNGKADLGFDFSGLINNSGIHGELNIPMEGDSQFEPGFVIGFEHSMAGTLDILTEYYHNGEGRRKPSGYDYSRLISGESVAVGCDYLGGMLGYNFSGILRGEIYGIINILDKSLFLNPLLKYSVITNLDLTIGSHIFSGNSQSEYGRLKNIYYFQLQWFF